MATRENVKDPFDIIGTTIEGKYRVASVIGDGGFGVVYRGVHTGFGELIAIKCLKIPTHLDEKHRDDLLEQLREEGRLLHKLSKATPGIVQALDVGAMTTPGGAWVPYLVLEWLEGETVGELMKRREEEGLGGMSITEAIELLTPAARALAVAHQHKIAHRDVKPANLFVAKVGEKRTVKVLDFGIAKVLTETTITAALAETRQGPSAFTPRYGAPEQFNKQRGATGPWTDVFALALILVELTTGRRALDGDDPTQLYVAAADPTLRPTFRGRGLDVADVVEAAIAKALNVEPKYRYADAGEMWDAITQAAGMPSDVVRSSQPTVSSGRSTPTSSDKTAASKDPTLSTGAYAAHVSLAVPTEARPSGPPEPNAQTRPIESVFSAEPPQVIVSAKPEAKSGSPASATSVSAREEAGTVREAGAAKAPRRGISPDDPMAETPLYARVPREVAASVEARAAGKPANDLPKAALTKRSGSTDTTTINPSSRGAPSSIPESQTGSGRGIWIALGVIVAGAGATAYLYFTSPSLHPGSGSGKASTTAATTKGPRTGPRPAATATSTGTASASDSASASESASASDTATVEPPAPPDDMVYIGPMTARLGEGPTAREVTLKHGFYIEKQEVSAERYHACVSAGACSKADEVRAIKRFEKEEGEDPEAGPNEQVIGYENSFRSRCTEPSGSSSTPVNCITYKQADQYCKWRSRRLPTEAEWEAAAQGSEARSFPWGNSKADCDRACADKNAECRGGDVAPCARGSHPGDKTPEEIFDLAGNVAEWVADGYAAKPLAGTDPRANPFTKIHTVRGGDFFHNIDFLRSATRRPAPGEAAEPWIGVRCAMDIPAPP